MTMFRKGWGEGKEGESKGPGRPVLLSSSAFPSTLLSKESQSLQRYTYHLLFNPFHNNKPQMENSFFSPPPYM